MQFRCRRLLSPALVRLVALLCACSASWSAFSSVAQAQAEQILVVSGEKVPDKLSEAVSDALSDVGSLIDPSGYSGNLRARHQAPDSEEALTKLGPQTGASLIVVLQQARNKVKVELRNGHTGSVIDHMSVSARGKHPKLAKPARKKLIASAKRALTKVGREPVPSKRASSEDDFAEAAEPEPEQPSRAQTRQPSKPSRPAPRQEQAEPEPDEDNELAGESDDEPTHDKPAASTDASMLFRLHAGIGIGSRSIVVPIARGGTGGNKVDTSFVPALDLGAALELPLGAAWRVRFVADYRTVFGLSAGYLTPAGVTATSSLSSHSLIAGASLGHLSDGRDSFGVHLFLGWAYRSLSAAVPSLPSASIQGLVLRPEIEIPIANRKLALRLAPELILILVPNATLPSNDSGLTKAVGIALGAEASLDLHISKTIGISALFRESHGSTPSAWGTSAIENERYLTLRFLLQF